MWINSYLLETLIAECTTNLNREAARLSALRELEPPREPRGPTLGARLWRAALALLASTRRPITTDHKRRRGYQGCTPAGG